MAYDIEATLQPKLVYMRQDYLCNSLSRTEEADLNQKEEDERDSSIIEP